MKKLQLKMGLGSFLRSKIYFEMGKTPQVYRLVIHSHKPVFYLPKYYKCVIHKMAYSFQKIFKIN